MNRSERNEQGRRAFTPERAVGQAGGPMAQEWDGAPRRATVRVAEPLTSHEQARLQAALERYFACPIQIEQDMAPEVIGGVWVRVGDTVIDGSIRGRLESLNQHLCARCRVMMSSGPV
jgi:hypothetical protein